MTGFNPGENLRASAMCCPFATHLSGIPERASEGGSVYLNQPAVERRRWDARRHHEAPYVLDRQKPRLIVLNLRATETDLRTSIAGFLDSFYRDDDTVRQKARLEDEPQKSEDTRLNAYLGAVAEHLCRRWLLGEPPSWVEQRWRFLTQPWFLGSERMKPILLKESPASFRRRLIFLEAEPLRRASMPRDGRWWYYETLRTGIIPGNGDIAPGRRTSD